jgi:hypothetical protein
VNFLQLCQQLAHEAGVNGPGPTTVVGQDGSLESGRLVNWVNQSWLDIQAKRNWSWMWSNAQVTIPSGVNVITGSLAPSRYDKESAYFNDGSTAWRNLCYMAWDEFRTAYRTLNSQNGVTTWTVRPDLALVFNATVSANTLVDIERYTNPTRMTLDADTPGMPEHLHELIIWHAMIHYADFDEAGVQRQTAVVKHNRLWADLLRACLPQMRMGGPLGDE